MRAQLVESYGIAKASRQGNEHQPYTTAHASKQKTLMHGMAILGIKASSMQKREFYEQKSSFFYKERKQGRITFIHFIGDGRYMYAFNQRLVQ